jgi:hypothetical protein
MVVQRAVYEARRRSELESTCRSCACHNRVYSADGRLVWHAQEVEKREQRTAAARRAARQLQSNPGVALGGGMASTPAPAALTPATSAGAIASSATPAASTGVSTTSNTDSAANRLALQDAALLLASTDDAAARDLNVVVHSVRIV